MSQPLVTVWNEFRHEKTNEAIKKLYPKGIHTAIAEILHSSTSSALHPKPLKAPPRTVVPSMKKERDFHLAVLHEGG